MRDEGFTLVICSKIRRKDWKGALEREQLTAIESDTADLSQIAASLVPAR